MWSSLLGIGRPLSGGDGDDSQERQRNGPGVELKEEYVTRRKACGVTCVFVG